MTLRLLSRLAAERDFAAWREALLGGKPVIDTENRPARHTALRGARIPPPKCATRCKARKRFQDQLRDGKTLQAHRESGHGRLRSRPAPARRRPGRCARRALRSEYRSAGSGRALEGVDLASTLFVLSPPRPFTTQETMANARPQRPGREGLHRRYRERRSGEGVRRAGSLSNVGLGRRALLFVGGGPWRCAPWVRIRSRISRRGKAGRRALRAGRARKRTFRC